MGFHFPHFSSDCVSPSADLVFAAWTSESALAWCWEPAAGHEPLPTGRRDRGRFVVRDKANRFERNLKGSQTDARRSRPGSSRIRGSLWLEAAWQARTAPGSYCGRLLFHWRLLV